MALEMEIKQIEEPKYLGELINSLVLLDHPKYSISMTMLSLLGIRPHVKRVCHTFKWLKRRSFNVPSPQNQRDQREQEAQPTQLKQTPLPSKQWKQYHNPDPISHLVGKVNEAHILINYVECLALIDSGAQISTVTIEFVKQLGLKIH